MLQKPRHKLEPLPDKIVLDASIKPNSGTLRITSSVFENNGKIPQKYTCDGEGINPPLSISGIPERTETLVLIMDDPDSTSRVWDHWIVFDIDPSVTEIKEGEEPNGSHGKGTSGKIGYQGPCPSDGEHRYLFKIFAVDIVLGFPDGISKDEVESAIEEHILDYAEIIGRYERTE